MSLVLDYISIVGRSKDAPSGIHLWVKTSRTNLYHKSRHTSTCCLGKQESPALFGWARFLLDGGRSERGQCGAPGRQSSAGSSVTSCEASNSNADEGGRHDGNCPVFSNNPLGWSKVCSSGLIQQTYRFRNAKGQEFNRFGSISGWAFFRLNPSPHWCSKTLAVGVELSASRMSTWSYFFFFSRTWTFLGKQNFVYLHGLVMVDSPTMKKSFVASDIKPQDLYDCTKAKICASVGWLLAKSYGCTGMFLFRVQAWWSAILFVKAPTLCRPYYINLYRNFYAGREGESAWM